MRLRIRNWMLALTAGFAVMAVADAVSYTHLTLLTTPYV